MGTVAGYCKIDNCRKPRITVHPGLLLELTHCVYYAVFNGYADAALSALDAVHQRSTIESFANVLLVGWKID